ncbi:MAG: hypothetical protein HY807_09670 [Nitrospirae bacterium]|nr:hypothetical protein [Nitrospirota bacterium]
MAKIKRVVRYLSLAIFIEVAMAGCESTKYVMMDNGYTVNQNFDAFIFWPVMILCLVLWLKDRKDKKRKK